MIRASHELVLPKRVRSIGKTNSVLSMEVYISLLNMHPVDAISWGMIANTKYNINV